VSARPSMGVQATAQPPRNGVPVPGVRRRSDGHRTAVPGAAVDTTACPGAGCRIIGRAVAGVRPRPGYRGAAGARGTVRSWSASMGPQRRRQRSGSSSRRRRCVAARLMAGYGCWGTCCDRVRGDRCVHRPRKVPQSGGLHAGANGVALARKVAVVRPDVIKAASSGIWPTFRDRFGPGVGLGALGMHGVRSRSSSGIPAASPGRS
jgi:hypothetical protein